MSSSAEIKKHPAEPSELLIGHMTLYHGSADRGVAEFVPGTDRVSVGTGVYLVDNSAQAIGYANRRANNQPGGIATLYEVDIHDLKLVNLSNQEKLDTVMHGFASLLHKKLTHVPTDAPWYRASFIDTALSKIHQGVKVGKVADVTRTCAPMFSAYLQGLGYDGLKTTEGGEGDDVGRHETYLIFDPSDITVVKEQSIARALGSLALT